MSRITGAEEAGQAHEGVPPHGGSEVSPTKLRRRPSGEPPPLPRNLRTSGRLLLGGTFGVLVFLILLGSIEPVGYALTNADLAALDLIAKLRSGLATTVMRGVDALGSDWTIGLLRWGTVLALLAFRRFRHLFVYVGSILAVGLVVSSISLLFTRSRPTEMVILGHWEGGSFPSRPVAMLAVTLVGITYALVVPGRARMVAKVISTTLILALGFAELYLAVAHPIDVIVAAILGAAIPVVAFRSLTPNEVFPVTYRGGRAAHLDVGGLRGDAIRHALEDQLGITVLDMKPFGLAGSGGSTPLRLRVAGDTDTYLFAKLYAANHLRADRWYKLGRTLLYGRLEDEASFSTVRRLVQYEDYLLRVMRDAGVHTAASYGFAEITPEREYVIVTDFIDGAKELIDAELDDDVIDDALQTVRTLWTAGIAHRDIKPSNLLVRDGKVHLIDVAFGEVRPSPWRQAVDLANMMLVLGLRSDAGHVYSRALKFFTPEEIAEAFAATRSVTMPSQSRSLLRKDRRDLLAQFRKLAPPHRRIAIQRWSVRRVALTTGVLAGALFIAALAIGNLQGAGLLADPEAAQASFPFLRPECRRSQDARILLETQSVPTASLVPCLNSVPLGWSFRSLEVRDGMSRMTLDSDRAGIEAAEVTLTRECDLSDATEVPSDEPGARRFEEIVTLENRYSGFRYYLFGGGCATYGFNFSGGGRTSLAEEVTLALGFLQRDHLEEKYAEDTGTEF